MGKGGGKGGKKKGKIIGSIVGIGLGVAFAGAGVFAGMGKFASAMYGMSLGSTFGGAFDKPEDIASADTSNFDNKMNIVDSNAMIPIVYGTHKVGGLQTYHKSNIDAKRLDKHIILCEGEIENVYGVTANGYILPYETDGVPQLSGDSYKISKEKSPFATIHTKDGMMMYKNAINRRNAKIISSYYAQGKTDRPRVFSIVNIKDRSATFTLLNNQMKFVANGHTVVIPLGNSKSVKEDESNSYGCFMSQLFQYILGDNYSNTLAEDGWRLLNPIVCSDDPDKLSAVTTTNAYMNIVNVCLHNVIGSKSIAKCYRGTETQSPPKNYLAVGGYPKLAYIDSTLKYCEEIGAGNPTITAMVQGRKVYDPRTKLVEHSNNPALCLLDYLTNKTYGVGDYITMDLVDIDSFVDVANYCDEPITYIDPTGIEITESRYELDLVINQRKTHLEVIQDILKTFAGFIVFSNDKIVLRCERKQVPVYAFNNDNIIESSVSYKSASIDQSPNKIKLSYIEPALDYTAVKVIVEDTVNQQPPPVGRGRAIEAEITVNGVTRQSQALRIGKIYRDLVRLCPITINFKTGMMAAMLEAGDVISISKTFVDDEGHEQVLFENVSARITEIKEEHGEYEITARQYNSSIYDDAFGATLMPNEQLTYKPKIDLTPEIVDPVRNLSVKSRYAQQIDGQSVYSLFVTWTPPEDNLYGGANVYYRKVDENNDEYVTLITNTQKDAVLAQAVANGKYSFKVIPVDRNGTEYLSSAQEISYVITPITAIPTNPTGVQLQVTDKALLTWDPVGNTDIKYYEARLNSNKGEAFGLLGKTNTENLVVTLTERTGKIYLYAVNIKEEYSSPTILDYNYEVPVRPLKLSVVNGIKQFVVTMGNIPSGCIGIKLQVGDEQFDIKTTFYVYASDVPDIYSIKYCYYDYFGSGACSDVAFGKINVTVDKDLLDLESLGIKDIDKAMEELQGLQGAVQGQLDGFNSKLVQTEKGFLQSVNDMEAKLQTSITQTVNGIDLKLSGNELISRINLSSSGTRIDGKLLHVTGQALFDDNIITNKMIQAKAVTADKMSVNSLDAISANMGTLTGGTIIGGRIQNADNTAYIDANGNIHGMRITGGEIDGGIIKKAGYELKRAVVLDVEIPAGDTLTLPENIDKSSIIVIPYDYRSMTPDEANALMPRISGETRKWELTYSSGKPIPRARGDLVHPTTRKFLLGLIEKKSIHRDFISLTEKNDVWIIDSFIRVGYIPEKEQAVLFDNPYYKDANRTVGLYWGKFYIVGFEK